MQQLSHKPKAFRDVHENFMTPRPLSYWVITRGGNTLYAEIAEGEGFRREKIYGVTVRPDEPMRLSKGVFYSHIDAMNYLESLEGDDEVIGD